MSDLSYLARTDIGQFSDRELQELLHAKGDLQQELFRVAREVRRSSGMDEVLLRGVIEISSLCQKRCAYCAMRSLNRELDRYRLDAQTVLTIARQIKATGINTAFLQAGQDPGCDAILEEVIPVLRRELDMDVLLCVGERPRKTYERYVELGATSYILKFETSDANLYEDVAQVSPAHRLECIEWIKEVGLKLGTGNIIGLPGQSEKSLLEDIRLGLRIKPDFISCAPFIANQDTPYQDAPPGDINVALNTMAIWRIAMKKILVPTVSALEKLQKGGQLLGLQAGANVITINFTPKNYRDQYKIYAEDRFVVSLQHALNIIDKAGLTVRRSGLMGAVAAS